MALFAALDPSWGLRLKPPAFLLQCPFNSQDTFAPGKEANRPPTPVNRDPRRRD